jgi:AcrR family transcriptional regulator
MSLRERKKAETRTAIADAAAQLFTARGFHEVTVGEVAEAAGVSKQTVFNHFANKEELVFDRAAEVEEIIVRAVRDRPAGTTAVDAFRQMTRGFWSRVGELAADRPQAGFFLIVERTPALKAYERELASRIVERVEQVIREQARARPDDLRPRFAAASLCGIHFGVAGIFRTHIAAGEPPSEFLKALLRRADEAYNMLADGVGAYPER